MADDPPPRPSAGVEMARELLLAAAGIGLLYGTAIAFVQGHVWLAATLLAVTAVALALWWRRSRR